MNEQERDRAVGELRMVEVDIRTIAHEANVLMEMLMLPQQRFDLIEELLHQPGSGAFALGWSDGPEGVRFCEVQVKGSPTIGGPVRHLAEAHPWEVIGQQLLLVLAKQETERSEGQRMPWRCMPLVCWYAIARYMGGRHPGELVFLGAGQRCGFPCLPVFVGLDLYPATRVIVDGRGARNAAGFEWEAADLETVLQYIKLESEHSTSETQRLPDLLTLDHAAVQMPGERTREQLLQSFALRNELAEGGAW